MCQDDQFLYPLTARRVTVVARHANVTSSWDRDVVSESDGAFDESSHDASERSVRDIEDPVIGKPLLNRLGECRKYDEFARRTFQRPEIVRTMCEFFSRGKDPIVTITASDRTDVGDAFVLANVLHWRYNGVSAVNSSKGAFVDLARMEKRSYSQSFLAQLTLAADATRERDRRERCESRDSSCEQRFRLRRGLRFRRQRRGTFRQWFVVLVVTPSSRRRERRSFAITRQVDRSPSRANASQSRHLSLDRRSRRGRLRRCCEKR